MPANDPTLLFTNAGMVQFKDVFLGLEKRPYTRATTSQRCVRAGGKHNDLENVGYTARHHTFFEMLGNFSFGDYFKAEAIDFAWRFLTEDLGLPKERLWVTVFEDDDVAENIWLQDIGVDPKRFGRIGASDNFWAMGDTGPCGPCSEIFYDHGPEVPGGPPGSPDAEGDRYVEIWNLVFMQFNRTDAGEDETLPRPSVDTGMGLERLAAVLQGVHSNYETDLFRNLIEAAANVLNLDSTHDKSLRVIADHIRSSAFLITDGVTPSNEGRGYVLRRIIRRAIRHGYQAGGKAPFFHKLVAPLVAEMGDAYPELVAAQSSVERALEQEGVRFAETLEQGLKILDQQISTLTGELIPGDVVFKLYDTFGFPVDLTGDVAREHGLQIDLEGFEREMAEQRERARSASQFVMGRVETVSVDERTEFSGYRGLNGAGEVIALLKHGEEVAELSDGEEGAVVLNTTPFYAESGGQIGDRGLLSWGNGKFRVRDVRYVGNKVIAHDGVLESGHLKLHDQVDAAVDEEAREATANNHSATHLLHEALRQVLGDHVTQKGSLVAPDRLRFDFSHFAPMSDQEVDAVEKRVNDEIRRNHEVATQIMPLEDARKAGAAALFGEKYEDDVRVVAMGEFSLELCGGTHVQRTGDIGLFKIVSESGIAAGVRRVEAMTGESARAFTVEQQTRLRTAAAKLKSSPDELTDKAEQLAGRLRQLEQKVEQLQAQLATGGAEADTAVESVAGVKLKVARHDDVDVRGLRTVLDRWRDKLGSGVVVVGGVREGKVTLIAGVTKDLIDRFPAGELIRAITPIVDGKGGGKPDMAQGGGTDASKIDAALNQVYHWVSERGGSE